MYRPTFAVDSIGEESPQAVELALRNMGHLLNALVEIDLEYLRAFPPQRFPPLYKTGVRYDRMEPPPGSACGDDDWQDIVVTYEKKMGDCEDLACIRVAELRERWGVAAAPMVTLRRDGDGVGTPRHLYHVMVRWPETLPRGTRYPSTVRRESGMLIECPSRVLGMK